MSPRQPRKRASARSDAASDPTAIFYIREAAELVGVTRAVIRDWERQGLLSPMRGANGYRLYTYDDIERARQIRDLIHRDRLNAPGVRSVLGVTTAPPTDEAGTGNGIEDSDGFGKHIRRLRQEQGLSLRAVAARTGLGASHISAIERSLTRPSMASVGKLAEALGSNFLKLIGSEGVGDDVVVRKDDRPHPSVDFPGMEIEKLNRHGLDLSAHLMTILPGRGSQGSYNHGGEEFILVLSGDLEVTLDETQTHVLHPMDAITFRSSRPHRWRNPGTERTVVVWVDSPPSGFDGRL